MFIIINMIMVLKNLNNQLRKKIRQKQAVKVIAGLDNFNISRIIKLVKAAEIGGATYVDIAANPKIVSIVKSITRLPVCVSSIDPIELYKCKVVGADLFEIGNFDCFYEKQIKFSRLQILQLVREAKKLLQDAILCVTIPHSLLLNEQIKLAVELNNLGICMFQTEGLSTKLKPCNNKNTANTSVFKSTKKASSALSSTYALAKFTSIPIIASSGIDLLSAPVAVFYGASAVGIGSSLHGYKTVKGMSKHISELVCSVSSQKNCVLQVSSWFMESLYISKIKV